MAWEIVPQIEKRGKVEVEVLVKRIAGFFTEEENPETGELEQKFVCYKQLRLSCILKNQWGDEVRIGWHGGSRLFTIKFPPMTPDAKAEEAKATLGTLRKALNQFGDVKETVVAEFEKRLKAKAA